MPAGKLLGLIVIFSFLAPNHGYAEQPTETHASLPAGHLHLSPALTQLLKQEMNAIQEGMQSLVPAIVSGNWKDAADSGEKIQHSYIMQQQLTPEQTTELHHSLPLAFQELDQSFHHSAGMLAHAAKTGNAEVVNFYFYKLMDTCVACHAKFAGYRFPGLATGAQHEVDRHDH